MAYFSLLLVVSLFTVPISSPAYSTNGLEDLTGAIIPFMYLADAFGTDGELNDGGHLSSRSELRFRVRIKNQSGKSFLGDSLMVVVAIVQDANGLHDVLNQLKFVGTDGQTSDKKPFYRVPLDGKTELDGYAESEEFEIKILNPNLLMVRAPVLRILGLKAPVRNPRETSIPDVPPIY